MRALALSLAILLADLSLPASGQCPGGRCGLSSSPVFAPAFTPFPSPVTIPASVAPTPGQIPVIGIPITVERYRWIPVPGNADQEALLEHGRQIGNWSWAGGYYRTLHTDGSWGPKQSRSPDGYTSEPVAEQKPCDKACDCDKCNCADQPACPCAEPATRTNFGMDYRPKSVKYTFSDQHGVSREISRAKALQLVDGPTEADIPDDSKKFRLVLIGSKDARQKALADAQTLPGEVKDKLLVHAYDASSPLVSQRKMVSTGQPTAYLLAPDGKVLGRNLDGTWSSSRMQAVEQQVKNYDPTKDPDLAPKQPAPISPVSSIPGWAWAAGGLALVLLLASKRK